MVEEEVRVGLDWVERVVATVDKRVVLEVENVLTFVNLSVAGLLMDAAADEVAGTADVVVVFTVDRKACAVDMNDAALTVTVVPPTITVAAGLKASIEESRAGSKLSALDCAAAPLCGRLLFPLFPSSLVPSCAPPWQNQGANLIG